MTTTETKPHHGPVSTVGTSVERLEGSAKVTGAARYSFEVPADGVLYAWLVTSTIASGRITRVDTTAALADPEVVAILDHTSAPRLQEVGDTELEILQSSEVRFHGQVVAVVVANSPEAAREGAAQVVLEYDRYPHSVVLDPDSPDVYVPPIVNGGEATESEFGELDKELAESAVVLDAVYTTPPHHTAPIEPHAALAQWDGENLLLYNSDQGPYTTSAILAPLLGIPQERVRVVAEHIGGGFGSKFVPRALPVAVALAAKVLQRPVKGVLTRQQMFALNGHRSETRQRVRLGADADGRLRAIEHTSLQHTSRTMEFVENTTTSSRMVYRANAIRTSHTVGRLDIPTPSFMRTPGHVPGMFGLETAIDELAVETGLDPVELRRRNEPEVDLHTGLAFSSRGLQECLRVGAERFGWAGRDPQPGNRRDGRWLIGTGVAVSTHPDYTFPATATVRVDRDGRIGVRVAGADIGTGARTALTQLAAEEFGVPLSHVEVRIGDSSFGPAPAAGGSMGTSSWSWPMLAAAREIRGRIEASGGVVPEEGIEFTADSTDDLARRAALARHTFGAQFAEVRVDADTGEVRVDRLHATFAAGRIINARTARSQFLGGMIMGLGMALTEIGELDLQFGDFANHDFGNYHIAANADVRDLQAHWIDEVDDQLNPAGVKGIGELGIVGAAAAIGNAIHHATGVRLRSVPFRIEDVRSGLRAGSR
ncbi:xanthine dehydrogenase family protein molybdopterin-binding subunit [Amycolatopsis jiangsuensis]|uniref:Xanthine dehydrogenase YagR molybdenum-binding subunit n=1 Tax=Amycolatopsis jiangsuensis TaxID=1181879 RepID=A0A840J7M3_9PSEU|nr:xanthine dehydrogenase family protein molybdopterin-binding subunit [Amycolatopsis jiangsuensis]MBB4689605.1 xanthine dehydrogenase YagR molybdenum-binding subunit [Amycolatopsis jiangsuensis]